jgi:beta-phosphoglucomutase
MRPVFPATLFDFNGVLVDDEHVHLEAFVDTLRPHGIALTEADYWEKYLGFDDIGAFEAILSDHGRPATPEAVKSLVAEKRPHYMTRARAHLKTFPGAGELIRRRAEAGPVGVVSGALRDEIEYGLEHLGVRALVGSIVSAEDTPQSKPDPQGYRMGQKWLDSVKPGVSARALVLEDSPAGIRAALDAELTVIALAHSYPVAALEKTGAHLVLERLADATDDVLLRLYQSRFGGT